jgi:hypothetical protein
VTYVHRRLWPALVRLAQRLGEGRLAAIRELHTPEGRHRLEETPFPGWVPPDCFEASRRLTEEEAVEALGAWCREL